MVKKVSVFALLFLLGLLTVVPAFADGHRSTGRGTGPIIYVESQGLYYDSIVTADPLPMEGRFQQLVPTAEGLVTEFGPGDQEFVGGRWWVDVNGNGEMDEGDNFFSCPLLGPGRVEA